MNLPLAAIDTLKVGGTTSSGRGEKTPIIPNMYHKSCDSFGNLYKRECTMYFASFI